MDPIPLRVTIVVPSNIPELRGRHATTPPHGVMATFRVPHDVMATVDRAKDILDPSMTRGLFVRLCAQRVAEAIIKHYDEYVAASKQETDSE